MGWSDQRLSLLNMLKEAAYLMDYNLYSTSHGGHDHCTLEQRSVLHKRWRESLPRYGYGQYAPHSPCSIRSHRRRPLLEYTALPPALDYVQAELHYLRSAEHTFYWGQWFTHGCQTLASSNGRGIAVMACETEWKKQLRGHREKLFSTAPREKVLHQMHKTQPMYITHKRVIYRMPLWWGLNDAPIARALLY